MYTLYVNGEEVARVRTLKEAEGYEGDVIIVKDIHVVATVYILYVDGKEKGEYKSLGEIEDCEGEVVIVKTTKHIIAPCVCESCGGKGTDWVFDPYTYEMSGEKIYKWFCIDCYNESEQSI